MERPKWNETWMNIAREIAKRSSDERLKVGAIVVPTDNTAILSIGYNGDEKGGTNVAESLDPGMSGFLHAEINALIKLNFNDPKNKVMYVTHFPCRMCCKAIVNASIKHVVYGTIYRDMSGLTILKNAGITVCSVDEVLDHT